MASVHEIYSYLNALLPRAPSAEWDNDGLMVCENPARNVSTVLFALDVTPAVAQYAADIRADLVISHHPLIFKGIRHMNTDDSVARKIMLLIKEQIAVMSFHTRLDAAKGGVNDILAETLGLSDTQPFGPDGDTTGRLGTLPAPCTFNEFCLFVKNTLNAPSVSAVNGNETIRRVAVLGGAGKDYIESAIRAGADALVTGEAGYNHMLDAAERGLSVIAAGHYHTEIPFSSFFIKTLNEAYPGIEFCRYPAGCEIRYF